LPKIGGSAEERVTVDAPLPEDLRQVWTGLGGEGDVLDRALADV
jgi:hypothetical protein